MPLCMAEGDTPSSYLREATKNRSVTATELCQRLDEAGSQLREPTM